MTRSKNDIKDALMTINFENRLSYLKQNLDKFDKEDLIKILEDFRAFKASNNNIYHKYILLDFLVTFLQFNYAVDFSLSEMVYTLLNEDEQEKFMEIIDTSNYPYIKLDFEADEVRRRVWERKLYFEFYCGSVTQIELYYDNFNAVYLKKNLRRLKKFKNLQKLNLLFFRGYPYNLIRTQILELKTFGSLREVKIYEFEENNPIPFQVGLV